MKHMTLRIYVVNRESSVTDIYRGSVNMPVNEYALRDFLNNNLKAWSWTYDDGGPDSGFVQFVAPIGAQYPYLIAEFTW